MYDNAEVQTGLYRVEAIAKLFGLSVRRIQQLTQEGILPTTETKIGSRVSRQYDLVPTIQRYANYLQDKAAGRAATQSEEELKMKKLEAEISLKESQAELHQLKTAISTGQYISVEEVQIDYDKFFTTFKKFALNLPTRIIGLVSGQLEPVESRRLEKEITQEVSGMLEAFVVAGTEGKPVEVKKKRPGRPRKAPES